MTARIDKPGSGVGLQCPLIPNRVFADARVEPALYNFIVVFDAWASKRHHSARRLCVSVHAQTCRGAVRILKAAWPRASRHQVISQTPLEKMPA